MSDHTVDLDLPRTQIKRIIAGKLELGDCKGTSISKDALSAFVESAKVFISYIASTANDICCEGKRQTISAEDVIKAVEELEFSELAPQLKDFLETYKAFNKERNQKRAEAAKASKKRKAEEAHAPAATAEVHDAAADGKDPVDNTAAVEAQLEDHEEHAIADGNEETKAIADGHEETKAIADGNEETKADMEE